VLLISTLQCGYCECRAAVLQAAKLCSSAANEVAVDGGKPALVGANKCTQGPAYWCSSQEHADECGVSVINLTTD